MMITCARAGIEIVNITNFRKLLTMSNQIFTLSTLPLCLPYISLLAVIAATIVYIFVLCFSNRHPVDYSRLSCLPFKSSRCQLNGHVFLSSSHFWLSFSRLVIGANNAICMMVAPLILFPEVIYLCCPRDTVGKT